MKAEESNPKKNWKSPEVIFISQNEVTCGASSHYHKNSIGSSHATNVGGYRYYFKVNGGGAGFAHHTKHFHYS